MIENNHKIELSNSGHPSHTKCSDKSVTDRREIFKASKQTRIEIKSVNIETSGGSERIKQLQERDIASIQNNIESIGIKILSIQQRMDSLDKMFYNIR